MLSNAWVHARRRPLHIAVRHIRTGLCRDTYPFSGALFVFRNRSHTAIKILAYDGNGFWLRLRRLSQGKLPWWPTEPTRCTLTHKQLQWLPWCNVFLSDLNFPPNNPTFR
jgi:transposase